MYLYIKEMLTGVDTWCNKDLELNREMKSKWYQNISMTVQCKYDLRALCCLHFIHVETKSLWVTESVHVCVYVGMDVCVCVSECGCE